MTNLVIAASGTSKEGRDLITDRIRSKKVAWWHWLQETWLVEDRLDRDAGEWRDELQLLLPPSARVLVLKVDPQGWAIQGPPESFDWLRQHWARSG